MSKHGGSCPVSVKTGSTCPIGRNCGHLHGKRTCRGAQFCKLGQSVRNPAKFHDELLVALENLGVSSLICPSHSCADTLVGEHGDCFSHRGRHYYRGWRFHMGRFVLNYRFEKAIKKYLGFRVADFVFGTRETRYVYCDNPAVACLVRRLQVALNERDSSRPTPTVRT